MWLLLWGSIIRNLVRMSTEGKPLDIDFIKKDTLSRFAKRASALSYVAKTVYWRQKGRGKRVPTAYPKLSRLLSPVASIDSNTQLIFNDNFISAATAANLELSLKGEADRAPIDEVQFETCSPTRTN